MPPGPRRRTLARAAPGCARSLRSLEPGRGRRSRRGRRRTGRTRALALTSASPCLAGGADAVDELGEDLAGGAAEGVAAEGGDLGLVGIHLDQVAAMLLDGDRELRRRV